MVKFLITLFLGWAGVHKFAEKKTIMGIIYLFTFGLFGIGWIYDSIKAFIELRNLKTNLNQIEVVGVYYRKDYIASILSGNRLYSLPDDIFIEKVDENNKIFRYKYREASAELIPEPTNAHDPNAIMVTVDGVHVGYIPASLRSDVKKKIHKFKTITAHVHAGDYKYHHNREVYKKEADFKIELYLSK